MPLGGQTGLLCSYTSASFNYSIEVEQLNFFMVRVQGTGLWLLDLEAEESNRWRGYGIT